MAVRVLPWDVTAPCCTLSIFTHPETERRRLGKHLRSHISIEYDTNSWYDIPWQAMGEGWRHNDVAKRLLEVALCASGRLGVVAYPGKPPTVIDEVFGHFIATVNPLVSVVIMLWYW